jgi:excisionase family DNA binding protein
VDADVIAELLDVPATWVREQARAGTIPHYRLGRYVRFDVEEVFAWLAACREAGRPARLRRYNGARTDNSARDARTSGRVTPKE